MSDFYDKVRELLDDAIFHSDAPARARAGKELKKLLRENKNTIDDIITDPFEDVEPPPPRTIAAEAASEAYKDFEFNGQPLDKPISRQFPVSVYNAVGPVLGMFRNYDVQVFCDNLNRSSLSINVINFLNRMYNAAIVFQQKKGN